MPSGALVRHSEPVVVWRINTVPSITMPDRAVEPGRKIASSADNAPGRAPDFIRVMHLVLLRRLAREILVTIFGIQHGFAVAAVRSQARDKGRVVANPALTGLVPCDTPAHPARL